MHTFFILYKVVIKSIATKSTSTVFCLKLFQFNSIFVHFTQLTNSNTMNNINLLKAKSITNKIITMQIDMHPRIKFKIRFKKKHLLLNEQRILSIFKVFDV